MKIEDCKDLKIGDSIKVAGICGNENEAVIIGFGYKAVMYRYLGDDAMEPKRAMYYDIVRKMTDDEVNAFFKEQEKAKKWKSPKCPDCKKPIDKCKCTE